MKKLTLLTLTLGLVASSAVAQTSDEVGVGVSLGTALTVTKTADLFFGTHDGVIVAADEIEVSAVTGAVVSADASLTGTDTERGVITVEGAFDAQVFVDISGDGNYDEATGVLTLIRDGGAEEQTVALTISDGTTSYSGAALSTGASDYDLDGSGDLTLGIGGTLTIVDTDGGFYRGEITVSISYF